MGFNLLARPYHFLEKVVFADRLQRARCARMEIFLEAEQILLLGEGDGRFLEALLKEGCRAEIICYDLSTAMLDLARKRVAGKADKVHFLNGDIHQLSLPLDFQPDVIGAHFFLDCFGENELLDITRRIQGVSRPGCKMVVTDFQMPSGSWFVRSGGRVLICLMLLFFRIFAGITARRLPDWHGLLTDQGWQCRKKSMSDQGLIGSWVMERPVTKGLDRCHPVATI